MTDAVSPYRVDAKQKELAMATEKSKDNFIEQWRGIAILLVVLYHFTDRLPPQAFGVNETPAVQQSIGWIGVLIFLIISGFLIAKSLESTRSLADFYAKRIARIWPLFIVANITIFLFLQFFDPPVVSSGNAAFYETPRHLKDLIGSIFFATDLGFKWIDGVFWSLLVELKFYVWIGLCAALAPKRFTTVFCSLSLVLSALDFAVLYFDRSGPIGFDTSEQFRVLSQVLHGVFISQYLPLFAVGVALYRNKKDGLFTAVVLMSCITALIKTNEAQSFDIARLAWFVLLLGVFIVIDHGVFKSAIIRWIAAYSYSIFLFHQMIGLTMVKYIAPSLGINVAILIALSTTTLIAVMASRLFEWRYCKIFTAGLHRLFSLFRLNRLEIVVHRGH